MDGEERQPTERGLTMIVKSNVSLSNFKFWSGAVDRTSKLTSDDFETIENVLTDMYPDGMTDTELNDFFWFEEDFIAECLGFDCWGDFLDSEES